MNKYTHTLPYEPFRKTDDPTWSWEIYEVNIDTLLSLKTLLPTEGIIKCHDFVFIILPPLDKWKMCCTFDLGKMPESKIDTCI